MVKARGLGRGFEDLIPTDLTDEEFDPTAAEDEKISSLKELSLDEIVPDKEQPRKDFDTGSLEALADSIKENGVLQPIVVTREEDKYKIVAGERRYRASKLAGLKTIPAIIRTIDAQNRLELSIIENAQREDLNAIELATAYAKLKAQFNLTTAEIAKRVGKKENSIVNTLRLLNLSDKAKKAAVEHKLSEGVLRPLINADTELVERVLPKIVDEGWSTRKVERYMAENKAKSSTKAVKVHEYLKDENKLSEKYGATVRVKGRSLNFACKDEKELRALIRKLV
ncbi:ParB/RepB/Spo0J family partition protein [Candidatus Saccharibacteria bacterium]|nr:ParB/RepB/Spo0J family partition protein [Candidatus Saccharibacteria bacterium]